MSEPIKGLTHVSYFCGTPDKFKEMLDFYVDKLGFAPKFTLDFDVGVIDNYRQAGYAVEAAPGDTWIAYVEICPGQFVELFNMGGPFQGDNSVKHVCYTVEDIRTAIEELLDRGVEVWEGPKSLGKPYDLGEPHSPGACGSYTCFLEDPAGNEVELMEYTDRSLQRAWIEGR